LNEKYLLPNQVSEEERKIKKLEKENQILKTRVPKLEVIFNNEKEFIKFKLKSKGYSDFNTFKANKLSQIKSEHPHLKNSELSNNKLLVSSLRLSQIRDYNYNLDDYYSEYEKCLENIFEHEKRESLSFEIEFLIKNTGNTPADDIDLHLHFPDGIELIENSEKEECPKLPKPPYRPKHAFDFETTNYQILPPLYSKIGSHNVTSNLNSPSIKKTNSYNVDFHRDNLKHGYSEKLEKLLITFNNESNLNSFKIDYKLSSANIPDIVVGKLNVIFEK